MGEPSARWVWNIHWSTRRLAFRVALFTCRMCRIMLLSSKIRKILSTLQLHSGMDCCLPLPCAIMFDSSSVPRLFSVSHLYHFLYYYRLTTAKGVYLVRVFLYCVYFVHDPARPRCFLGVNCLHHAC